MHKKQSAWMKMPMELLQKELSLSTKIVYAYMLWRYTFFIRDKKGTYFESQDSIAEACSLSRKTVNESIQGLVKIGWLTSEKSTMQSCRYTVKDVFDLYTTKQEQEESEPF